MKWKELTLRGMRLAILCLSASCVFPSLGRAQAPVFEIARADSSIKFNVAPAGLYAVVTLENG